MRPLPLAVAALLLVAGLTLPAATAPTPETGPFGPGGDTSPAAPALAPATELSSRPVVDSIPGTTSYLSIPDNDIRAANIDVVTIDVGAAVAGGGASLDGQYEAERTIARVENADNTTAAAAASIEDIVDRTRTLREQQAAVTAAYNSDELSTRTYLRELAVVGQEAEELSVAAGYLIERSNELGLTPRIESDARRVQADLNALSGPVRPLIAAAFTGSPDAPTRFAVETSSEGVALSTLHEGVYYREAYLGEVRTATAPDGGFRGFSATLDAVLTEFYPWAFQSPPTGVNSGGGNATEEGIFRFVFPHEQGSLTAFVSRDAGEVFAEFQTKRVADAPVSIGRSDTSGGVRLEVGLTHPGGQLFVRTTSSETGQDIDAAVYIEGERVGRTGDDGVLYTLTPRGRVNTTVVFRDDRVSLLTGDEPT